MTEETEVLPSYWTTIFLVAFLCGMLYMMAGILDSEMRRAADPVVLSVERLMRRMLVAIGVIVTIVARRATVASLRLRYTSEWIEIGGRRLAWRDVHRLWWQTRGRGGPTLVALNPGPPFALPLRAYDMRGRRLRAVLERYLPPEVTATIGLWEDIGWRTPISFRKQSGR